MQLHPELKSVLDRFLDANGLLPADTGTARIIVKVLDDYVHKNWTVLGTFSIAVYINIDSSFELKPGNLYTAVVLIDGPPNMAYLTRETYDCPKYIMHWNEGNVTVAYKNEPFKLIINKK